MITVAAFATGITLALLLLSVLAVRSLVEENDDA